MKVREDQLEVLGDRVSLRLHDLHLFADAQRIVRAHLRPESVFERSDDAATRRVVLGVGAGDDEQVERQPDSITSDLHVLLFHDVEEADLDAFGEVWQLVDAEDAAVGARQQAVVDGQLVRQVAALGNLDRVDLADEVGDRDVGRRQLLAVAPVPLDPRHLNRVTILLDKVEAPAADRRERVVVDLAARDRRHVLVEQRDQRAHDAALGLPALAEKDHVVTRDDGIGELRKHGVVVPDDAGEQRLAGAQARDEVSPHLLLDGLVFMAAGAKLGNGPGLG